jgi:hypothetical protein
VHDDSERRLFERRLANAMTARPSRRWRAQGGDLGAGVAELGQDRD